MIFDLSFSLILHIHFIVTTFIAIAVASLPAQLFFSSPTLVAVVLNSSHALTHIIL